MKELIRLTSKITKNIDNEARIDDEDREVYLLIRHSFYLPVMECISRSVIAPDLFWAYFSHTKKKYLGKLRETLQMAKLLDRP